MTSRELIGVLLGIHADESTDNFPRNPSYKLAFDLVNRELSAVKRGHSFKLYKRTRGLDNRVFNKSITRTGVDFNEKGLRQVRIKREKRPFILIKREMSVFREAINHVQKKIN